MQAIAACIAVPSTVVRAKDLDALVPELRAVAPETEVVRTPAIGLTRFVYPSDISRALGKTVAVPGGLCVQRQAAKLTLEVLEQAIRAALPREPERLEIVDFSRYPAPPGRVVFGLSGLETARAHGPDVVQHWSGRIETGQRETLRVWVKVKLQFSGTAAFAMRDLELGKEVLEDEVEWRRVSLNASEALSSDWVQGPASCVPRRRISSGQFFYPQDLDCEHKRQRGGRKEVEAVVRHGAVQLRLKGTATGFDRPGSLVQFRAYGATKALRARWREEGVLEVISQ